MYDITLPLRPDMPVWPGDPTYQISPVSSVSQGDYASVSQVTLGTHTGTHVDAPAHLFADGAPVDHLPLDILIGEVQVVDCINEPRITAEFLALRLRSGCERVLFRTQDELRRERLGQSTALDVEAARLLMLNGVRLVGVSGASVDADDSSGLPVHRLLLGAGVVVIENLVLLQVPAGLYQLYCLPLPLTGADAAPARVILLNADTGHFG